MISRSETQRLAVEVAAGQRQGARCLRSEPAGAVYEAVETGAYEIGKRGRKDCQQPSERKSFYLPLQTLQLFQETLHSLRELNSLSTLLRPPPLRGKVV